MTRLKLFFCLIISIVLEIFIVSLALIISILDHYKIKDTTSTIVKDSFWNLLSHPINVISDILNQRNPILIIGTIILLFYMTYIVYKSYCTKKNQYTNKKGR